MATRKVTVVREMTVGERRSFVEYDDETKQLIRPDARLTKTQQAKLGQHHENVEQGKRQRP